MDAKKAVLALEEPAVATDGDDHVVVWNEAAARMFGIPAAKAIGRPLQDLLDGRDVFGNRLCRRGCAVHESLRRGEPLQSFEMDAAQAGGRMRLVVMVELLPGPRPNSYFAVYHIQAERRGTDRRRETWHGAPGVPPGFDRAPLIAGRHHRLARLTGRESEILQMLGRGSSTAQIARSMGVSSATVRSHMQNLLRKLGVHSRLQAVSVALEQGLL